MTSKLEHEWELELPAATAEQLLAALTTRDRLYGQSITLEPEDDPAKAVEVWLASVKSLEKGKYRLGVYAELAGPKEFLEVMPLTLHMGSPEKLPAHTPTVYRSE